jgi:hypothetical protein
LIKKDLIVALITGTGRGWVRAVGGGGWGNVGGCRGTDPFLVQKASQVLEKGVESGVVSIDYNSVND